MPKFQKIKKCGEENYKSTEKQKETKPNKQQYKVQQHVKLNYALHYTVCTIARGDKNDKKEE